MGGGISNTQVITEEGKYSLDVIQNNPSIEGTLASKIEKLETTSPVAIKDIELTNVRIDTKYNTVYFRLVNNFFADNNIPGDNVISIILKNWSGGEYIFTLYAYSGNKSLGFMSPAPQTLDTVVVRVVYLK